MRLLGLTDIHGSRAAIERILSHVQKIDAILLGGDITNFGSPEDAEAIVRIAQAHCDTVLAVAGNCDSAEIDDRLAELGVSVFERSVEVDGVGFYGLSAMPPWLRSMYSFTEEEIAEALQSGSSQLGSPEREVLLSHSPPHATTVDRTFSGQHVGSTALRAFVEERQPELVICGHIHEARGTDRIGRTTIVNCGQAARGHFALITLHDEVDVELGTV